MSAPTPDKATPSSAELRESAAWSRRAAQRCRLPGPRYQAERHAELWDAGADAMDSLATVQAQRDRLAEALRACDLFLACGFRHDEHTKTVQRHIAELRNANAAALAELEGGAS